MSVSLSTGRILTIKETLVSGAEVDNANFQPVGLIPTWVASAGAMGITKCWFKGDRLLNATSENWDLNGGAIVNQFGIAVSFTKIKKSWLRNIGTGNILLSTTLTNGWQAMFNGTLTLPPGASIDLECPDTNGWAVTPGTGDLVQVVATTSGGKYEIAIAGE